MSKAGRITVTFKNDGEAKVVAYPKNKDNQMYCTIMEYLLNSNKCKEQIKKEIFIKLARVYDVVCE